MQSVIEFFENLLQELCCTSFKKGYFSFINNPQSWRVIYNEEKEKIVEYLDKNSLWPYEKNAKGEPNTSETQFDNYFTDSLLSFEEVFKNAISSEIRQLTSKEDARIRLNLWDFELSQIDMKLSSAKVLEQNRKYYHEVYQMLQKLKQLVTDYMTIIPSNSQNPATPKTSILGRRKIEILYYPSITLQLRKNQRKELVKMLFEELKEDNFIAKCKAPVFNKLFSGEEFHPHKNLVKITWSDGRSLKYFWKQLNILKFSSDSSLKNQEVIIFPTKGWDIIGECFVNKEGQKFNYLSTQSKNPSNSKMEKIDSILNAIAKTNF